MEDKQYSKEEIISQAIDRNAIKNMRYSILENGQQHTLDVLNKLNPLEYRNKMKTYWFKAVMEIEQVTK